MCNKKCICLNRAKCLETNSLDVSIKFSENEALLNIIGECNYTDYIEEIEFKINYCPMCGREVNKKKLEGRAIPYSQKDYLEAEKQGLNLDNWNDYQEFYGLGVVSND